MKSSDNHMDREWVEERMEAYVDGLLPGKERKVFESMVSNDAELALQVDLAHRVREALGELPRPACPAGGYQPVLDLARRQREESPPLSWLEIVRRSMSWRLEPVRVIVTASLVLAAAFTLLFTYRGATTTAPDAEEVQAAMHDVKLALSYVSLAGREAGSAIRNRAVDQSMIGPVARAIERADIGSIRAAPRDTQSKNSAGTAGGKS